MKPRLAQLMVDANPKTCELEGRDAVRLTPQAYSVREVFINTAHHIGKEGLEPELLLNLRTVVQSFTKDREILR